MKGGRRLWLGKTLLGEETEEIGELLFDRPPSLLIE